MKRHWMISIVFLLIGPLPVFAVLGLATLLAFESFRVTEKLGLATFLSLTWRPATQDFGILALLCGTVLTAAAALVVAVLVGLPVSVFLSVFAGRALRIVADATLSIVGGLPSVVIGLFGLVWLVPELGFSWLSAVLVLSVMITPTFTLLTSAAIRQAPFALFHTARALGVPESASACLLVRHARFEIAAAARLAFCRALGEAIAVSFVCGNVAMFPPDPLGPTATLSTTMVIELNSAAGDHMGALHVLSMAIVAAIAIASLSIGRLRGKSR